MSFLTEEEKRYIMGAGEQWDGKTIYNQCNQLSKKSQSAFKDMIWLLENIDSYRKALDMEFMSKYKGGNKPPKRPQVTGEKFISKDDMEHFLELYIQSMIDTLWWEPWNRSDKAWTQKRLKNDIEKIETEVKEPLRKAITETEITMPF